MLIITIKRNNLKSKVNLKTKMVCEIITIRNMSQLSTIRWQVNFFIRVRSKEKPACSANAPHLSLEINWRKKNSISPSKIDVDEA